MNNKKDFEKSLFKLLASVSNEQEMANLMRDLCTPQEISALAERWRVCQLLHEKNLTYREISEITGVSLATITRVARFLKDEPHRGYQTVLKRKKKNATS